jgi:hypothetical protein
VNLKIPKKIADQARREGKRHFPSEAYMELIGVISKNNKTITVIDSWIPKDLAEYSSPFQIEIPPHWRKISNEYARSVGGVIVGTIHSHGYSAKEVKDSPAYRLDPSPSSADIDSCGDEIMGILVACQDHNGKFSTRLRLYGPSVRLSVSYTK